MDIFDEVAEDLRNEKAISLAKRYGGLLLLGCVAVLAGVAAQEGWQAWQAKRDSKAAQQYLTLTAPLDQMNAPPPAAQAEKAAAALSTFAATAPEGYKTLANMRAAALYADAGKLPQAEALWTGVAQDSAADPLLRDAATLIWAQHALGAVPDADVLAKLQPLALSNNPYHAMARELQALAYLHQGNVAQAKALLTQISMDGTSPSGVRQRAQALLASLNG